MIKKILAVDDDPDITQLVKTKLEKTGRFSVVTTNSGAKALELARIELPDLVLCDIDMPDKFGGEVAEDLAGIPETKDIPILFLSSLVRPNDVQNGKVGGRLMVSKSSNSKELIARIDALLNANDL